MSQTYNAVHQSYFYDDIGDATFGEIKSSSTTDISTSNESNHVAIFYNKHNV